MILFRPRFEKALREAVDLYSTTICGGCTSRKGMKESCFAAGLLFFALSCARKSCGEYGASVGFRRSPFSPLLWALWQRCCRDRGVAAPIAVVRPSAERYGCATVTGGDGCAQRWLQSCCSC
jgi:hypothetical protein